MKKQYKLFAVELCPIRIFVESDKSPEEFDSLDAFYDYADFIGSKGMDGEIQEITDYEELKF